MKLLVGLAALLSTAFGLHDSVIDVDSFTGFQVYRTFPKDQSDASYLQSLRTLREDYDFWTEVRSMGPVDIMVPPGRHDQLGQDLELKGISYEMMIPDVQKLIDLEKVASSGREAPHPKHAMTWTEYHTLEDMYTYLDYLEETFDFVSTEVIGQSSEGRDIRVASVCRGGCGEKKAVWIDGGIHAREWVSPAATSWMLKELVENDAAHTDLTEGLDWYFVLSANPDGYAYSRDHSRMWRKTRSDNGGILRCKGVDANRNWGYHWNEGGSSNDKCSDTYHGPAAFSEPENVAVSEYILARKDKLIFYNSIHSYSQLILLPWGFQSSTPDDYDQMYELALRGGDALTAVHGKIYETGCIPCMLYIASGSSTDWAHGEAGIGFTTSMELRDTGAYGFLLPPAQIIPTAEETWAFHITVIRELMTANE
jgi:murein tripeptide amidase MpaA